MKDASPEIKLLIVSTVVALVFAVVGIFWGLAVDSRTVVFDGMYSFVSVLLSLGSIVIVRKITLGESERFPFGRAALEPILVVFRSLVLIGFFVSSGISAVFDLMHGGTATAFGPALMFSSLSVLACAGMVIYLDRGSRHAASDLLRAERDQWRGDTLLSFGVTLGFLGGMVCRRMGWDNWVSFIDPSMVLIAIACFLPWPTISLLKSAREMITMAPPPDVLAQLEPGIEVLCDEYGFSEKRVYLLKIGRELRLEVNFLHAPDDAPSVRAMDVLRDKVLHLAHQVSSMAWVNVSITSDRKWL